MSEMSARAARVSEIGMIHGELMTLIDEMPYYNALFKAHEKARLDKTFLRTLLAIDPWHLLVLELEGKPGGFMISGPDCGTLFQYWSCIFPAYRKSSLGMYGMRAFTEHWDNGRFHKASTYVRPDNRVALMLLKRYGYTETCVLRNHIFGEDYCVMERPYTKAVEGYDAGVRLDLPTRLRLRARALFER